MYLEKYLTKWTLFDKLSFVAETTAANKKKVFNKVLDQMKCI